MLNKVSGISFSGNVYKDKKRMAKELSQINPLVQDDVIENLNALNNALKNNSKDNFFEIRLKQYKYFLSDAQKPSQYAQLEVKRLNDGMQYKSGFYIEKHGSEERIINKDNLKEIFDAIREAALEDCKNSNTTRTKVYYNEEKIASELTKIQDRNKAQAIKENIDAFCSDMEENLDEDCILGIDFSCNKEEGRIDIYIPYRSKNKHLWDIFPLSQDVSENFMKLKSYLIATTEGKKYSDEYKLRELRKEGAYEAIEVFNKLI